MVKLWTDKHGPDELYDKFRVQRVSTGEWLPDDLFAFVLVPERDEAACDALYAYAQAVEHRAPVLAEALRKKVAEIELANGVI